MRSLPERRASHGVFAAELKSLLFHFEAMHCPMHNCGHVLLCGYAPKLGPNAYRYALRSYDVNRYMQHEVERVQRSKV